MGCYIHGVGCDVLFVVCYCYVLCVVYCSLHSFVELIVFVELGVVWLCEGQECLCVLRSKRVDCWRKDWDKAVVILMVVLK